MTEFTPQYMRILKFYLMNKHEEAQKLIDRDYLFWTDEEREIFKEWGYLIKGKDIPLEPIIAP